MSKLTDLPQEVGYYIVSKGMHEDFKEEVYVVTNKETGIIEFSTPVLPQAFSAASEFTKHWDAVEAEVMEVTEASISVVKPFNH